MYRFVVCVDVDASDLQGAYEKLLGRMQSNDWESTDEAYDPEGEQVLVIDLDIARGRALREN